MNEYNGIKIGDLITAYWKGFYELVEIIPRYEIDKYPHFSYNNKESSKPYSPIFVVKQLYRMDGKSHKSKKKLRCDAGFCKPASQVIEQEILELERTIDRLKKINEK